jgi:predicted nucleotidyltransferase
MSVSIDEKLEEIAASCQRYGIERLFVFGSALRDDFRPGESDIDLLVKETLENPSHPRENSRVSACAD